jgi:DNA-directed RNA polymerase specialized sigma24 family protein
MSSVIPSLVEPPSFDVTLAAAQARVPGAAAAFIVAHDYWVAGTVAALCRRFGLPAQEHADTKQETYSRLLDPRFERFAPARGGGKKYVRGVILNAIDFAGRRRRLAHVASWVEMDDPPPEEVDPRWREPFDRLEARMDLPRLLRLGDDVVARAVTLIRSGRSQREAAKEVGVSEFTLCRALAKFSAEVRLAA